MLLSGAVYCRSSDKYENARSTDRAFCAMWVLVLGTAGERHGSAVLGGSTTAVSQSLRHSEDRD